jgi:hypothetical protein
MQIDTREVAQSLEREAEPENFPGEEEQEGLLAEHNIQHEN